MQRTAQHQFTPGQGAGHQRLGEPLSRPGTQGTDRQIVPDLGQVDILEAQRQVQEGAGQWCPRGSGQVPGQVAEEIAGQIDDEVPLCGQVGIAQHQLGARDLPATGRNAPPGEAPAEAFELEGRVE